MHRAGSELRFVVRASGSGKTASVCSQGKRMTAPSFVRLEARQPCPPGWSGTTPVAVVARYSCSRCVGLSTREEPAVQPASSYPRGHGQPCAVQVPAVPEDVAAPRVEKATG
jgi:hypothetical protein